jgi:hypothetical protein
MLLVSRRINQKKPKRNQKSDSNWNSERIEKNPKNHC